MPAPSYYIRNANIVNEGSIYKGSVLIENGLISKIVKDTEAIDLTVPQQAIIIDADGKYLFPGFIDDQVHFREPGLTHKADIYTESKAAVAGGVTSFMDMPNTIPNAVSIDVLEEKYSLAATKSLANYSFFLGATNNNIEEICKADPEKICGVKVFMGASTGNMLVDDEEALEKIFKEAKLLIAVHCEDENIIKKNIAAYQNQYGENIPIARHPLIRSEEACYKSSLKAVGLAKKYNSRLHVLHLSTAKELSLFDNSVSIDQKRITAEVCIHHLWFCDEDYAEKGSLIKCNPAIKTKHDCENLLAALLDGRLDIVATDHAPHLLEEKNNLYLKSPSGIPLVQHSLVAMLEFYHQKKISLEKIAEKMCHAPAVCYKIKNRGFIREGFHADITLVDINDPWKVEKENILYKCGWSPFEEFTFQSKVKKTFVNGRLIYDQGAFNEDSKGQRLTFER
jgi:dihydroorotase